MKTKIALTSLAMALMLGSGAALADIKIGVSMSQFDDTWLTYLRDDMSAKAKVMSTTEKVDLQFVDARADVNKQLDQVKDLINKKSRRADRQSGRHRSDCADHQGSGRRRYPAGLRQPPPGRSESASRRRHRDVG